MKFFIPLFLILACVSFWSSCQNTSTPEEPTETVKPPIEKPLKVVKDTLSFDKNDYQWEDGHIVLNWKFLSRVKYEDGYINDTTQQPIYTKDMSDALLDAYVEDTLVMLPIYHDDIKVLDGKPIQIHGYLIPLQDKTGGKMHFLSAYPMSQCFFCGAAGPETLMDVLTKKRYKGLKMDDKLTFRGILHLNDTDLDYMNYVLKDAELIREE